MSIITRPVVGAIACAIVSAFLPGATSRIASAAAVLPGRRPERAIPKGTPADPKGILLAEDEDWIQLPARGRNADSEPTTAGSSGDEATAEGHPQLGPSGAPVTIVEFSDFQCPYCQQAESALRQVRMKYRDSVRLVYMDFPLRSHPNAMDAAMAARCAGEQGQFWPYHDALFADQSQLSVSGLKALATQLRLNVASFDYCLDRRKYASAVLADKAEGKRVGVGGTPYFLVNGRSLSGAQSLAKFQSVIDRELESGARR